MIDTDKYEGHTGPWLLIDGDIYKGGPKGTHKSDNMIADTAFGGYETTDARHADSRLMVDAPLLLEEVKRLREVIDTIGYFMTGSNKENPAFDWSSRQTIANLDAEVKRLREGRLDIIKKAADILTSHGIDCADLHDYIIDRLVNE